MKNLFIWPWILIGIIVAMAMMSSFPVLTPLYLIAGFILFLLVEYALRSEDEYWKMKQKNWGNLTELTTTERCLSFTFLGMIPVTLLATIKVVFMVISLTRKNTNDDEE